MAVSSSAKSTPMRPARANGSTMSQRTDRSVAQGRGAMMIARMAARALSRLLPSLIVFATLLGAWQLAGPVLGVREYLLPGSVAVLRAAFGGSVPWPTHLWVTTLLSLDGLALSCPFGVARGIAIASSTLAALALQPFIDFVNTLPKVAVTPLFLQSFAHGSIPNVLIA